MAKAKRKIKEKRPWWKCFKFANEESMAKLPRDKPSCIREHHRFLFPDTEDKEYVIARCSYCKLRWIFKAWIQERIGREAQLSEAADWPGSMDDYEQPNLPKLP